ncbi:hypothetical protein [Micromonospora rhizosphaerae]|nr:hypothetical protein [Micromonospora rhizosphaerae]
MREEVASESTDHREFVRDVLREDYMLTRQQQRELLNTFERNLAVLIAGLSLAVAFGKDTVSIVLPFALTVIAAYQLHQLGDMQMLAARRHCLQMRLKDMLPARGALEGWTLPDDAEVGDSRSYSIGHLMLVALGGAFAVSATLSVVTAFRVWHWALASLDALFILGAGWFLVIAACEMLLALSNTYAAYSQQGWPTPSTRDRSGGFERLVRATLRVFLLKWHVAQRSRPTDRIAHEDVPQQVESGFPGDPT